MHARVDLKDGSYALMATDVQATVAAVFVHGFYGHCEKTWFQFQTLMDSVESSGMFPWWRTYDAYFYSYDSNGQIGPNTSYLLDFIKGVFPAPSWNAMGRKELKSRRRYNRSC